MTSLKHAPIEILAADYKARNIPPNEIYTWFIKDRDMSPEVSAKDLQAIVEDAHPLLLSRNIKTQFLAPSELTHLLTYNNGHSILIKLVSRTDTVLKYITEYGGSGSSPVSIVSSCTPISE